MEKNFFNTKGMLMTGYYIDIINWQSAIGNKQLAIGKN